MSTEVRGKIRIAVELDVHYVVRLGLNPLVMESHLSGTFYPLTVLPPDAQETIFNACIEAAREADQERRAEGGV